MLRALRHWLVAQATHAALAVAPRIGPRWLARLEAAGARLGPHLPVVARQAARNMRTLGVHSPQSHRAHFAHLAAHFVAALRAFQLATAPPDAARAAFLAPARTRFELDASVDLLVAAQRKGRGVVLMGPHLANFVQGLAVLSAAVPLTVYFRAPKDARRQRAKDAWYHVCGLRPLTEPRGTAGTADRLGRLSAAVAAGEVVYLPPDLPRKLGEGVAVPLFGREICLPPGPAALAVRTGAPLFVLLAEQAGERVRLVVRGPAPPPPCAADSDAARRAAVAEHMRWFAAHLEQFIRTQAPLWYFWADKRWTRVLRGDRRYVRPMPADGPAAGRPRDTAPVGAG